MALGSGSTTVAITSIASSLLTQLLCGFILEFLRASPSGFRLQAPASLTPATWLNFNDIKKGDVIEAFVTEKIAAEMGVV
jgi:hypothetical protein